VEARRTKENAAALGGKGRPHSSRATAALQTVVGLILLVIASRLFLYGGRRIGAQLGISERMLGLTVIALGTALPELIGLSDLIGLVAITLLGILMLRGSRKISRLEGLVLVLAYLGFIATAAIF